MDSKISAAWCGQRLARAVRLSIFLMAAVAIAAVCAGGVPATGGAATDGAATACLWLDANPPGPPWGADYGLQNTAWVAVGYGESNKNWGKYRALTKASGLFQHSIPASYRSIKLGYGSQAFLATVDLWGYYGIAPGTAVGGFPQYLYDITVFSRHHNVLEVAFMTASLAQTKGEIDRILKTSF